MLFPYGGFMPGWLVIGTAGIARHPRPIPRDRRTEPVHAARFCRLPCQYISIIFVPSACEHLISVLVCRCKV